MALGFEQDSSIFRVDDIYTFIIAYFLPDMKKSEGEGVKIPVSSKARGHTLSATSHKKCLYFE